MTLLRRILILSPLGAFLLATLASAAPAQAAPAGPFLHVSTFGLPTVFSPEHNVGCSRSGACDTFVVLVQNRGAAASEGEITILDHLPAEVVAVEVEHESSGPLSCELGPEVRCTYTEPLPPAGFLRFEVKVTVEPGSAADLLNRVEVSGGDAPTQEASVSTPVDETAPPFGFAGTGGGFEFDAPGPAGITEEQAGSHPGQADVEVQIPSTMQLGATGGNSAPVEDVKNLVTYLPMGMVGNPLTTPRCPASRLVGPEESSLCPQASQVGVVAPDFFANVGLAPFQPTHAYPIYNMVPEAGYPAQFAFRYLTLRVNMFASVVRRDGEYELRVAITGLPRSKFRGFNITFFGSHSESLKVGEEQRTVETGAFLTDPSDCASGPLDATIEADTWQNPTRWVSQTSRTFPQITGCSLLRFAPTLSLQSPEKAEADQSSGYDLRLDVPQEPEFAPNLATPPVRDVNIAFPEGVVVSPSAADGLEACQATGPQGIDIGAEGIGADGLGHLEPGHCPGASQVATVSVKTPLLEEPLEGHIFLAQPSCGNAGEGPCTDAYAASGRLLGAYLEVEAPQSGVNLKLPGTISADPSSGRLTAHFLDNPQFPLSALDVHVDGGPRAPLATPQLCGTYTTGSEIVPWSAPETPTARPGDSFPINTAPGGHCAHTEGEEPNAPSFEAGTTNPIAGSYSPFVLKLSREDGSQRISSLEATLPAGLLGRLAGIPYCPDAAIAAASGRSGAAEKAAPSCPAGSEVGTVNVGAGAGTPYYVQGKAYLAGPYKGAPISLAIITPAVAGPFDLGTVVVRTALYVNEYSAQVRAVSDRLPSMLAGIPLDIRSIALQLSRPDFTLNPSSCEAKEITGAVTSTAGQTAQLKNRFQVGACGALAFKPGLKVSLSGQTKRIGHPALKAVLTYPKGQSANVRRALVNLPGSEFLDQGNLNKTCTKPVLQAGKCPASTIYGKAKAWTPLLEKPLEGPVYLVGGFGYKLPALVAELNGQIRVLLVGKVDSGKNHGIRNTFEAVPDAPVSRFVLEMKGGKKYGLLENSQNICKHQQKAIAKFTAQNGKTYDTEPVIQVSCGKKSKKSAGKKR